MEHRDAGHHPIGNGIDRAGEPAVREVQGLALEHLLAARVEHRRADQLATGKPGQPRTLLRLAAAAPDRLGSKIDAGQQRHGSQRPPCFFRHQAQFEQAQPGSAELFRNGCTQRAQFAQVAPGRGTVGRLAVQHRAHFGASADVGQDAPDFLLQAALVFGEIEVHALVPFPQAAAGRPGERTALGPWNVWPLAAMSRMNWGMA